MSIQKQTKIKNLIQSWPPGLLALSHWLENQGISRQLQKRYVDSGWMRSFERGVYQRVGDTILWQSGLHTLQSQAILPIHVGALTALAMQGFSHYVRAEEEILLFSNRRVNLPLWFKKHTWDNSIKHIKTIFLSEILSIFDFEQKNITIKISTPERAILECLYLAPHHLDLIECYQVLQGLVNLRPQVLSDLLQECQSIKGKRLFLYMSEKANHQWYSFLDISTIDLGSGSDRKIGPGGVYISKFNISIPKELGNL